MWILYVLNSVYNKLLIVHPAVTRVLIGVCQPPVGEEGPAEEEGQEEATEKPDGRRGVNAADEWLQRKLFLLYFFPV